MAWQGASSGIATAGPVSDAVAVATNFIDQRATSRDGNTVTGAGNTYSIVGMNADKIPTVTQAIEGYVERISKKIGEVNALANADNAFKGGEIQKNVQDYVGKVKEYAGNLVSQLKAFEDELDAAYTAWNSKVSSFGNTVQNDTQTFQTGETYTRPAPGPAGR